MVRVAAVYVVLAVVAVAGTAGAQESRSVSGVVQRTGHDTTTPVADALVVLHRVGRVTSGPLDSARSDARGRYTFRYRTTADSAVYFASTKYAGVTYFTSPLATAHVSGDDAEIVVFDTTSVGARIATRSRHIVIFAGRGGMLPVSEVYWLENPAVQTRVATASSPSWESLLPTGAANIRVDGGDVAPDAVSVREGRMQVISAFSPGLRQVQVSYTLPSARSIKIPIGDTTSVLEVLTEDAGMRVAGAGLAPQQSVTVQQRSFNRYLAQGARAGAIIELTSVNAGGVTKRSVLIGACVGLAGLAILLGFTRLTLNPGRVSVRVHDTPRRAEDIAHAIAVLDARFEGRGVRTPAERADYIAKRDALKSQLTAVLAERDDQL